MTIEHVVVPGIANGDPTRKGNWMATWKHKRFWPKDPREEDFCLEDIAHASSIVNRFGGHSDVPVSVAAHSVLVAETIALLGGTNEEQYAGLFHDCSEAYIGDMVRPLKYEMPEFQAVEDRLMEVAALAFGFVYPLPEIVHLADNLALGMEVLAFKTGIDPTDWNLPDPRDVLGDKYKPARRYGPKTSERRFLACQRKLAKRLGLLVNPSQRSLRFQAPVAQATMGE